MDKIKQDKIINSFENVNIKTTSDMILSKFSERKKNKVIQKSKAFKLSLIGVSSALVIVGSGIGVFFLVNSKQNHYAPIIIDNKNQQAAFELLTGIQFFENEQKPLLKKIMNVYNDDDNDDDDDDNNKNNTNITKEQFSDLIDVYHENYLTYDALLSGNQFSYTIEQGTYKETFNTYIYKMNIQNKYFFYYNDGFDEIDDHEKETNYKGEVKINNNSYQVLFTVELNNNTNKKEVEMNIYYSATSYLEIEYGQTANKSSYEYTYVENNQEIKTIEFEIKQKNNNYLLELEIEQNEKVYEYEVVQNKDSSYSMAYTFEDATNYRGEATYYISETSIKYIENKYNYEIIKIIQ